jgi:predicted transcriptional regulator
MYSAKSISQIRTSQSLHVTSNCNESIGLQLTGDNFSIRKFAGIQSEEKTKREKTTNIKNKSDRYLNGMKTQKIIRAKKLRKWKEK